MIDKNRYTPFIGSDNRMRAFDKLNNTTVSYPRLVMEDYLGRALLPSEDVHHKDHNPLNNDISNLVVLDRKEHYNQHKKYFFTDMEKICPICGNKFIWTAKQQATKHKPTSQKKAGPFCSKRCQGIYGATKQNKDNQNIGKFTPKMMVCPICGKEFIWSYFSQLHYSRNEVALKQPCCSISCRHKLEKQSYEYIELNNKIYETMKLTNGNMVKTARLIGISAKTVKNRLKQANLLNDFMGD